MTAWHPAPVPDGEERAQQHGDVGGDAQVTDYSWGVRYWRRDDPIDDDGERLYRVCSVSFYGEDSGSPGEPTGVAILARETEMMLVTDRADPGSTERWAQYIHEYVDLDGRSISKGHCRPYSADDADAICWRLAREHTVADVTWNGTREWRS